jgi:hypothetical protein
MFKEGDLLKVKTHDEKTYSVYVLAAVANGNQWTISIKYLDFIPRVNTGSLVEITHTKNPGYNREAYDKWGMFKCDFDETTIKDNQNAGRLVTAASAKHTDAWSLRKVTTQLGADLLIDYESDIIGKSVIDNRTSLVARDFVLDETNKRIAFKVDNPTGVPLNTLFPVGSKLDMALLHQAINNATRGYMQMPFITLTRDNALYFNSVATLSGYRNTTKYTRGTSGGFTVYSIDAATGTIVMNCSDPFYYGSNEVLFNQQIDTRLEKNIIAGNLYFYNNEVGGNTNYGGGIRVKELMIQDESRVYSTKYNYNSISTGAPSGVTSYEPNTTDSYLLGGRLETVFGGLPAVMDRFKAEYRAMLGQGLGKVTTLSRVLSSPNVMYEYVTVSSEVKNITANGYNVYQSPGKTTYQFVVPSETSATYKAVGSYDTNDMGTRNFVVEDNTAAVGTMKRKIDFDNLGNRLRETIVSTTNDNVLSSTRLDKYNRQGEIMERYAMQKRFRDDNGRQRNFAMTTARIEEPTITSSEKVIDHKNGATTIREFVKYDYYSGQLVQSVETDLYGNRFLTEIIPAYRQYADMSLKVLNANNKHMLTQEAGKYVYKVNAANAKQVLLTGEIQTWSNEVTVATAINSNLNTPKQNGTNGTGNVWRKQSQYIWAASGTSANNMTPIASFIDFNWANPAGANTAWRKKEEITLYDVYSKDLEAKDMNENYAAVRMGYNNTKVLMTGSNATQAELAFSGAEDAEINGRFSGYISKGDGVVQTSTTYPVATAHSGYNSLKVDGGKTGFNYTASINTAQRDIGHVASVWVKSVDGSVPNASIYYTVAGITNYGTIDPTRKSGDWYLLNIVSYYDFGSKTFGCINNGTSPVYFDDFNVHPMVSNATAYVYDKFSGQVSYIINPNNLFTRFEYDNMDRLKAVYKETLSNGVVKTQDYEYNYGKGQ